MKNNLLKKFLSFSYGGFVGAIIGFLSTMIMTRLLPPEEFGKVSMFLLAAGIFSIFITLGTDHAFARFFYEEEESKRGALLYNCIKPVFYSALGILVFIFIFNKQISLLLFDKIDNLIILLLTLTIIIQSVNKYAVLVVRMQQKGHLFSVMEILNRSLTLLLTILFYYLIGPTFEIIAYSILISLFLLSFYQIYNQREVWKLENISSNSLKHSKSEIINYSYPLLITALLLTFFEAFDKIALSQLSNFVELGLYAAAFKIVGLLTILKSVFITFWSPVAYQRFEEDPNNSQFFSDVSKIVTFIMFLVSILTIMFKDLIIFLLGSEYNAASNILPFLMLIPLLHTISETTVIGINFYKKTKWHIIIVLIACIFNVIGNLILVPTFGGIGAAISTGLSYILFFTLRTVISLRFYRVDYSLHKLYTFLFVFLMLVIYSTFYDSTINNILLGILSIFILTVLYFTDLMKILKKYKQNK